ncbi:MAG: TIR protein [Candidatus Magnetoglobus multicellularis str. Araruama]|uniref:TIR protein n=1 Tax=Candidatus Magnetoglobus multicellularis str. Araruama TaxID=890399 RepID=A0A1V1NWL8_9BACT|nr:MAG: TIR protein [Candidatus Magnetoglobus multicellularis str. Araruama]
MLFKETFKQICLHQVIFLPDDDAQSWLYQYGLIREQNDFAVITNPIYKSRFSDILHQRHIAIEKNKKIFISYAHEDKDVMDTLVKYLNIVKIHNIDFWFDQKLRTGDDWPAEIQNAIETAHVTICLVSNSYLGSSFVQKREFPAIQIRQKEGMVLFPIIIKDCLWKVIPWFKNVQVFPEDGTPLVDLNEKEQEKKLMALVQQIFDIFDVNQ